MRNLLTWLGTAGTLALAASAAVAAPEAAPPASTGPDLAIRQLPSAKDGDWVGLTGTVTSVSPHRFVIRYGHGAIAVDMTDFRRFDENSLRPGDGVTVAGRIDEDAAGHRLLDASSVYVPAANLYFIDNSPDEETGSIQGRMDRHARITGGIADDKVVATGTVRHIDGEVITLDTGPDILRVDGRNVLDVPIGWRVEVGDRVAITGELHAARQDGPRRMTASTLVILSKRPA